MKRGEGIRNVGSAKERKIECERREKEERGGRKAHTLSHSNVPMERQAAAVESLIFRDARY